MTGDREGYAVRRRELYRQNREKVIARRKEIYSGLSEEEKRRRRELRNREQRNYRLRHREKLKNNRETLRLYVLKHYGNGEIKCVDCGNKDIRVLTIDHVNGRRGESHRLTGQNLYRSLIRDSFPVGYETVCMNCNFIRRIAKGFETGKHHTKDMS